MDVVHSPLIALISATSAAICPATLAIKTEMPDAVIWNILDDRLLLEAEAQGGVTPALALRMNRLIEHAINGAADAVLLTCSIYGPVANDYHAAIPVDAPDDAAFEYIAENQSIGRLLVLASLAAAASDTSSRLKTLLKSRRRETILTTVATPEALAATSADDPGALLQALERACEDQANTFDAVLLAQYSLSPAASRLESAIGVPVITGPDSAARRLRVQLHGESSSA